MWLKKSNLCRLLLSVERYSLMVLACASSMMFCAVRFDITALQKNRVAAVNWNSSRFVGFSPWSRYWKNTIKLIMKNSSTLKVPSSVAAYWLEDYFESSFKLCYFLNEEGTSLKIIAYIKFLPYHTEFRISFESGRQFLCSKPICFQNCTNLPTCVHKFYYLEYDVH